MKLLLKQAEADHVTAIGGHYGNVLEAAASAENDAMMQSLLEAGTDIEPEPKSYSIELFPLYGQDESQTMPPEPLSYSIEMLPLDDSADETDNQPPETSSIGLNSAERNGDGIL
ncbi:hypothetical protein K435DRAFT_860417 [Dendrothele bispora CBS 962.96]|uniref:Ankyrin n=1 Tax=Dendrothele bispora (strain CBS 962.96) TaxID=1314807 RepID=A0A4S8LXW3_DENBC|nr:hypothetical protein K435DRAFT_860417 [Dendrothele bispora CBS 962.96]